MSEIESVVLTIHRLPRSQLLVGALFSQVLPIIWLLLPPSQRSSSLSGSQLHRIASMESVIRGLTFEAAWMQTTVSLTLSYRSQYS